MGLIDADDFYERMENDTDLCAEIEKYGLKALKKYLDLQPTAYDVDEVLKQLEERKGTYFDGLPCEGTKITINEAIRIVLAGGLVSNQDNFDARR